MNPHPGTPRYASWLARVGAGLIDLLFLIVVTVIAVLCMRLLHSVFAPDPDDVSFRGGTVGYAEYLERTKNVTRILVPPTLLVIFAGHLWNVAIRQGRRGQSLGKQLVRIRLVDLHTGRTVGVGRSFVRQFAHAADAFPCYLGYLWPLWDAKRQTLADKITGTVVIAGGLEHVPAQRDADQHAPMVTPFPGVALPSASFPAAAQHNPQPLSLTKAVHRPGAIVDSDRTASTTVTAPTAPDPTAFGPAQPDPIRKRRKLLLVAGGLVGVGLLLAAILVALDEAPARTPGPAPVAIAVPPVDILAMSPDGRHLFPGHRWRWRSPAMAPSCTLRPTRRSQWSPPAPEPW